MITKIIVGIFAFVWVAGWIIFIKEMCNAEEAYQDDTGYHVGKDPRQ
jgi:hypothetical protein